MARVLDFNANGCDRCGPAVHGVYWIHAAVNGIPLVKVCGHHANRLTTQGLVQGGYELALVDAPIAEQVEPVSG